MNELTALRKSKEEQNVRLALLEREVAELKAARDRTSARGWQLASGVLLAVVGGLLGYLLKR